MTRFIASLVVLFAIAAPSQAAELTTYYSSNFVIQGTKAYQLTTSYDDETSISTKKIEQYDFPSLTFINSISIKEENGYVTSVQVEDNGMLVNKSYTVSEYVDNDDGSTTVTNTTTDTTRSYDLNFTQIGEKITEDVSSYTYYPYYDGFYSCPDDVSAKKAAARVLAKKKGGKRAPASCTKVKVLSRKVIK